MPEYPDQEWRCSCGDKAKEPGDGSGLTTIRAHQLGKKGHSVQGLYADESLESELLVAGPKRLAAESAGYITPKPAEEGGSKSKKASGKNKMEEGNVNLGVQFANIKMRPSFWGWVSLIMPYETKDDGAAYDNTNEGIGEWLYDVVELHGRQVLALLSQNTVQSPQIQYVTQLMRGSVKLKALPVSAVDVPDPDFTNVEDVLSRAFRDVEGNAEALAYQHAGPREDDSV